MNICSRCAYRKTYHDWEFGGTTYRCKHPSLIRQRVVDLVSGDVTYVVPGPNHNNENCRERPYKHPLCDNPDGKCKLYKPSFGEKILSRFRKLLS